MCCFSFLGKVIALVLAFIFISMLCSSVWMLNMYNTAFQSETYLDTFKDQNVYETIVPLVLPAMAESLQLGEEDTTLPGTINFGDVVKNLNQEDWKAIASEVIPADYLQTEAERNLSTYFDFVNGERPRLDIVFETRPIRDNLLGQPGDRMVNRIFSSWETCTPEQETQVQNFVENKEGTFPYCRPDDSTLQRNAFTILTEAKNELANEIPERWDVRERRAELEGISITEVDRRFYEEQQRPTVMMRSLYPLAFLMPSALLAMIVIVTVRSGKSFFSWMGWTVAAAGLFSLVPLAFVPLILPEFYASPQGDIDAIQAEAVRGMARSLVGDFTMPILLQGALLAGIGFVCVFVSILLPDPDAEEEEEQRLIYPPGYGYGSTPHMPSYTPSPTPYRMPPMPPSLPPPAMTPPPAPTPPPFPPQQDNDKGAS